MADKKISQLTGASTPLTGTEVLPVVQSSATVKVSVDNLTAGKTVPALKFYATSTDTTPLEARRTVDNNTCLSQLVDSPSTSNCNYLITGIDTTGGTVGYASSGVFVSTGANGTGTARPLILHTYGNNDIVFARQNTQVGSVSANGFKPIATKGVDYSANTPAAGMTSQLLNWYEEGTWTPTIIGSSTAGTGTYSLQEGTYTRIGRQVTVTAAITWSAHTGSGVLRVSGLPFTIKNDNVYAAFALEYANLTVSANAIACIVTRPGQTYLQVDETVAGGASQSGVTLDTAASLYFSVTYFV